MNALPGCRLALTDSPDEWREWCRNLLYDELVECKSRLNRENLNTVSSVVAAALGAIIGIIDREYVRRFPGMADSLTGAVKIAVDQADEILILKAKLNAAEKKLDDALQRMSELRAELAVTITERDSFKQQVHGEPVADSETWSTPSQKEALEGARP